METIKVTVGKKANGKKIKNRNKIRWDPYKYLYSYFYYLIRTPILNNKNQSHVGKKQTEKNQK